MRKVKYIKLFENFDESKLLYRTTNVEWISGLINNGIAYPNGDSKFISFSKYHDSGSTDFDSIFGDTQVDFDSTELYKQGAIDIEYTLDFFNSNPDIALYITEYYNEQDYIENRNISMDGDMTWEEKIKSFESEGEVIMRKVKFVGGMIKKVFLWDIDERDDLDKDKEILRSLNLNFEVPWEK